MAVFEDIRIGALKVREFRIERAGQLPRDWSDEAEQCDGVRVIMPSSPENAAAMHHQGFAFRERTLGMSASVLAADMNRLSRMQRLPVSLCSDGGAFAEAAACRSFALDWRFCLSTEAGADNALLAIKNYLESLPDPYYATISSRECGFVCLEPKGEDLYVALAAADPQTPVPGAGMALYAFALKQAVSAGFRHLVGRVASWNIRAMDAYLALGARIRDPEDVFVAELQEKNRHGT